MEISDEIRNRDVQSKTFAFSAAARVSSSLPVHLPHPDVVTPRNHPSAPHPPGHPGVVPHVMQLPSRVPSATRMPASQRRTPPVAVDKLCNCRNSKCLKLYCECFASGRYCNSCNCLNCLNNKEHEVRRSKAIETILERNPNAFRPKIQFQQGEDGSVSNTITRHTKGCSCRKSNCLKKYCECFQAGIYCALTCRCKECRNFEGSEQLLSVMNCDEVLTSLRRTPPLPMSQPMAKRQRTALRVPVTTPRSSLPKAHALPTPVPGPGPRMNNSQRAKDPAREAIKTSREKKFHEVLAHMLVKMHMEVGNVEQNRESTEAEASTSNPAPGSVKVEAPAASPTHGVEPGSKDWATKEQGNLSNYYVSTEGVLLQEFGDFLGKICDRIDQQVQKGNE